MRRLLLAALILGVFALFEFFGGRWAGSHSLVADSAHFLADILAAVIVIPTEMAARRIRKSAYLVRILGAFLNGFLLLAVCVLIAWQGIGRLFVINQEPESLAMIGLGLAALILVGVVYRTVPAENPNLRAFRQHLRADIWSSMGVVVGGVVVLATGFSSIDPIVSIGIALFIAWHALHPLVEAIEGHELQ